MSSQALTYTQLKARLESDQATSFWLRDALASLERRDLVDALSDAEILCVAARKRFEEIIVKVPL